MVTEIKIIPIRPAGRGVDTIALSRDLRAAMRDTTSEGQRFIAKYPPQIVSPVSRYRRTGTLKRSWSKKVTGTGGRLEGTVGSSSNIAPYNKDVQGRGQLDQFRRRNWRNVDELEKLLQDKLRNEIDGIIERMPA